MKRRTTLLLTGMTLLSLAIAGLPQPGFAQSDPFLGTWQLNLGKSKYSPGPPSRPGTVNIQADGKNLKGTTSGTNANGNTTNNVFTLIFDGIAHPPDGQPPTPDFDAVADARVDAYTVIRSFTKAGKLVRTETGLVSPDGKTLTATTIGIDASGRPINNITVRDKQ